MQAISANDQIEASDAATGEADVNTACVLREVCDGLAEEVVGLFMGCVVEDLAQVAPQDLHVAGHEIGGKTGAHTTVGMNIGHGAHAGLAATDFSKQTHPVQQVQVDAASEIHRIATVAKGRRLLDEGRPDPLAGQPPSQRRAGDAGPRYQDVQRLHEGSRKLGED